MPKLKLNELKLSHKKIDDFSRLLQDLIEAGLDDINLEEGQSCIRIYLNTLSLLIKTNGTWDIN